MGTWVSVVTTRARHRERFGGKEGMWFGEGATRASRDLGSRSFCLMGSTPTRGSGSYLPAPHDGWSGTGEHAVVAMS